MTNIIIASTYSQNGIERGDFIIQRSDGFIGFKLPRPFGIIRKRIVIVEGDVFSYVVFVIRKWAQLFEYRLYRRIFHVLLGIGPIEHVYLEVHWNRSFLPHLVAPGGFIRQR